MAGRKHLQTRFDKGCGVWQGIRGRLEVENIKSLGTRLLVEFSEGGANGLPTTTESEERGGNSTAVAELSALAKIINAGTSTNGREKSSKN